ncbi:MAG TPA: hypothetical protein VMG37_06945 [Solirubrobacteraceae bacterium]|nr:hypothetical protein [Solirubrobacteraceae bacterium]
MSEHPDSGNPTLNLRAGDIEAIAEATAARLSELVSSSAMTFGLVDARQLAHELGVSLDFVYSHAGELGAMRLGSGPRARIRFDLDRARRSLEEGTTETISRRSRTRRSPR